MLKNTDSTLVCIRKIQRLRSLRSLARASIKQTTKYEAFLRASEQLDLAVQALEQVDRCVGTQARVMFSQLAIKSLKLASRRVRDAESSLSMAKHENSLAFNHLKLRQKQLALAQGALDVAEKIALRAFQEQRARSEYLSDSRVLEEFVQRSLFSIV